MELAQTCRLGTHWPGCPKAVPAQLLLCSCYFGVEPPFVVALGFALLQDESGSSGGISSTSASVNRYILQLAQEYCGDCKNSFDELSKIIQVRWALAWIWVGCFIRKKPQDVTILHLMMSLTTGDQLPIFRQIIIISKSYVLITKISASLWNGFSQQLHHGEQETEQMVN